MKSGFDLLARKSVASYLSISVRTLERMHKIADAPPRIRIGGQWKYPRADLEKWYAARLESATESTSMRQDTKLASTKVHLSTLQNYDQISFPGVSENDHR